MSNLLLTANITQNIVNFFSDNIQIDIFFTTAHNNCQVPICDSPKNYYFNNKHRQYYLHKIITIIIFGLYICAIFWSVWLF